MSQPWRLRPYLLAERRRILLGSVAMVGRAGALVLLPWPLKLVVNSVILHKRAPHWMRELLPSLQDRPVWLLNLLGATMLVLVLADSCLDYIGNRMFLTAAQRIVLNVREDLFGHLARLPLAFHRRRRGGELMSRLSEDAGRVKDIVTVSGTALLPHVLTLCGIIAVMLSVDWRYALLAMSSLPLLIFVSRRWSLLLRSRYRQVRNNEGELWAMAQETLGALPLVQACGQEEEAERRFSRSASESLRSWLAANNTQAQFAPLVNLLIGISGAAVIWYGAVRVMAGTLTPGDLLLFLAYLRGMLTPARQLAKSAPALGRATVAMERIRGLFAEPLAVADMPGTTAPPHCSGQLEFRGVGFAHAPGVPTLADIGFRLEPGRLVALVGPTGAGKSTIAGLAVRLADPGSGQVLLDGTDLRSLPLSFVRRHVSLMLQDAPLLHGAIWENIAYGRPGADRSAAIRAAIAAGVHEVIAALPDGYDHQVAERGAALSGGQRQCIAIARATLAEARVVILDEPSSSLDAGTERRIAAALARLTEGCATLVIAHRLATIQHADLILVVEAGRIVQRGTHRVLREQDGLYAQLLRAQERRQEHGVERNPETLPTIAAE